MMTTSQPIALEVNSLSKRFGTVQALQEVSIKFIQGEVHAIVGENGAGKSTLVNILAGELKADSGSIVSQIGTKSPEELVAMVHQHFMLVPALSVRENLQLAASKRTTGMLLPGIESETRIARELGWELPLDGAIQDLSIGMQQRIEIIKALAEDKPFLILDEPTAVLSPPEVEELMGRLRNLRDQGKAIILIAHKLSEVMSVADQITVLRNGKVVASEPASTVKIVQVAAWMVGEVLAETEKPTLNSTGIGFSLEDVSVASDRGHEAVNGVTLSVSRGEIIGIGGVDGNGQLELAEAVAGIRPYRGTMTFNLAERAEAKIAYIPQDRHRDGLALQMTVFENLLIGQSGPRFRGFIPIEKSRSEAAAWSQKYDVRTPTIDVPIRTLSGGNQQKVIVARILEQNPDAIVAVNPTRGLDVRATLDVHRKLLEAAEMGMVVLVFSTDLDELQALANRTYYLDRGKLKESLLEAISGDSS
jgi:simple sugar transport system ATP-binding protein